MKRTKRKADKSPLTDPLRRAVLHCDLPLLTLERETGVKRASVMRFLRGEQSLRLDMADKLAAFFGLELCDRKRKAKRA